MDASSALPPQPVAHAAEDAVGSVKDLGKPDAAHERDGAHELVHEHHADHASDDALRRDRLLASLTLTAGTGLALAVPFALRAGAEFFMPVTAALVIAVALVPVLEWLERRRVPATIAALTCVLSFLAAANLAIAAILLPAVDWFTLLPQRIGRVKTALAPILDLYTNFERFIDRTLSEFGQTAGEAARTVRVEMPNSSLDLIATSAPYAAIQTFFALLVIFFFLSGWTRMRKHAIVGRASFTGAMTTARVISQVVTATSTYLGTITIINVGLGLMTAAVVYAIGMPTPLMWGGIVAVLNYVPYLGPIAAAVLLGLGGLMTFADPWTALLPAAAFAALHLIEANAVTPLLVGKRLTINPLLILLALSFWTWVWGTTGALLAVPLLIIMKTVLDAAGRPDIAGFLFEDGTLTHVHGDDESAHPSS